MKHSGFYRVLGLALFFLIAAGAAEGAYRVTKTADTNDGVCDADCSLREAVAAAIGSPVSNVVDFSPSLLGTPIVLTLGEILLNNVKVIGFGAKYLTISGGNSSRIFYVANSSQSKTTIAGVTLIGGTGAGTQPGGNPEPGGGAIRVNRDLILDRVRMTANASPAVYYDNGGNFIRNSTFDGNGGVDVRIFFSNVTIVNSTLTGNTSIAQQAFAAARDSTLSGLVSVSGNNATFTFANSIVGDIFVSQDPAAIALSLGNNILMSYQVGESIGLTATDQTNISALLGVLADNGGPTPTMTIGPGSPAIDAGSNSIAATAGALYDQRRFTRVVDGNGDSKAVVDIGAYEYLGVAEAAVSAVSGTVSDLGGLPVGRASVTLTDLQGKTQTVLTNPFGGYVMPNVAVGEVYMSVEAKGHRGSPFTAQVQPTPGNTINISVQ